VYYIESIKVIRGGEVTIHLVRVVNAYSDLDEVEYVQGTVIMMISLCYYGTVAIIRDYTSNLLVKPQLALTK
jgi:hypothetical protein